jgi:hypothetical protein
MRSLALGALLLVALAPGAPRAGVAEELGLSAEEAAFCRAELAVIQNRRKVYERKGLPADEQRRHNRRPDAALAACRTRYAAAARAEEEDRAVREEVARRLPHGSELARERVAKEVRLDRAGRAAEAAGAPAKVERAAAPADASHRRAALSASLCVHERQLEAARRDREAEARIGGPEAGRRAYFWRAEMHRLEENLASERSAVAAAGGRLPCGDRLVSRLVPCVALPPSEQELDARCGGDLAPFLRAAR